MTNFRMHGFPIGADVTVKLDQGNNSATVRSQHHGESDDVYAARKKIEPNPPSSHSDPTKMAEHMNMLALIPKTSSSHVALRDGIFEDPSIWSAGTVPGASPSDKFLIPDGVKVTVTGQNDNPFHWGRIDGTIEFSRSSDTRLVCETLVSINGSTWDQGTFEDPIPAAYRSEIFITDNGDIDTVYDTNLSSRGLMMHGRVRIHGADKDAWHRVATVPNAGATSVTLASVPSGWEIGDMIVISGTTAGGWNSSNTAYTEHQDEVRTITDIAGAVISFAGGLLNSRSSPRADLMPIVQNLTRNVFYKSQSEAATELHRRGHFMVMHTRDADIRYLECAWLGRTNKGVGNGPWNAGNPGNNTPSNLPGLQIQWPGENPLPSNANVQGRYGLHFHRNGPDVGTAAMAKAWGCSVRHSPGWGIVHHDSHCSIKDCVLFDIFGAGVVAEKGTETGEWINNAAVGMRGIANGPTKNFNIKGDDLAPLPYADDMGRTGDGFWFQGRLVNVEGNVAASCHIGFNYFHRVGLQSDSARASIEPVHYEANASTPLAEALYFADNIKLAIPQILNFRKNESFACKNAGGHVEKEGPEINSAIYAIVGDHKSWNCAISGFEFGYIGHYQIHDFDIINCLAGITIGQNMIDVVCRDNTFTDVPVAFNLWRGPTVKWTAGEMGFLFVNNTFNNVAEKYKQMGQFWDPAFPTIAQGDTDIIDESYTLPGNTFDIVVAGPAVYDTAKRKFSVSGSVVDEASNLAGIVNTFPYHPDPSGLPPITQAQVARGEAPDPVDAGQVGVAGLLKTYGFWNDGGTYYTLIPLFASDRLTGKIYRKRLFANFTSVSDLGIYSGKIDRGNQAQATFEVDTGYVVNTTEHIWSPS